MNNTTSVGWWRGEVGENPPACKYEIFKQFTFKLIYEIFTTNLTPSLSKLFVDTTIHIHELVKYFRGIMTNLLHYYADNAYNTLHSYSVSTMALRLGERDILSSRYLNYCIKFIHLCVMVKLIF